MTIPTEWMQYINIIIGVLLIVSIVAGYIKGFFIQLIDILAYILAFFIAKRYASGLASRIQLWPKSAVVFPGTILQDYFYDKCNYYFWFILLFLGILLLTLILKPVIKAIGELPFIKEANKALGMVLGVVAFFIWITIAVYLLSTPVFTNGEEVIDNTLLKPIKEVSSMAFKGFSEVLEENGVFQKLLAIQDGKSSEEVTDEEIDTIIEFFSKAGMNYQDVKETVLQLIGKNE